MDKDDQEREANHFAICLLMPEKLVRDWIKKQEPTKWDATEDDFMKRFAKDFGVSMTLAAVRLHQLGILKF